MTAHESERWPVVYIASPYTLGNTGVNVHRQLKAADTLIEMKISPIAPLLTHFLHCALPRGDEEWMQVDLAHVARCDALIRLPGESRGADREVALAEELHIPVFRPAHDEDLSVLVNWATIQRGTK